MKKQDYMYFSILATYIILIICLALYLNFLYKYMPIPGCPIYKHFGLYCPACGCTRSVIALLHFNIKLSLLLNPIIIYTFVLSTIYLIIETINKIFNKNISLPWKIFVYIGLIILIICCILKNCHIIFI